MKVIRLFYASSIIRILIVLISLTGFCYQTWTILAEYLKYPTTKSVSLEKYLNVTIAPQYGIRLKRANEYRPLKEIFESINDTSKIMSAGVHKRGVTVSENVTKSSFLHMNNYYVSLSTPNPIKFSPDDMYLDRESFMGASLEILSLTSILKSKRTKSTLSDLYVFVQPQNADFEGIQKPDIPIPNYALNCDYCSIYLTYSIKIIELAPPPYETECLDYKYYEFTSSENCFTRCLSKSLSKHRLVIESNVLKREKYENSPLMIVPWYMRTLETVTEGSKLSVDYLQNRNNSAFPETIVHKIIDILPEYEEHWAVCKKECQRPDCHTENNVPFLLSHSTDGRNSTLSVLDINIYPPIDLVTIVTSKPKLKIIDIMMNIFTGISFWFGFCPLQIAAKLKQFISPNIENRKVERRLRRIVLQTMEERQQMR